MAISPKLIMRWRSLTTEALQQFLRLIIALYIDKNAEINKLDPGYPDK